MKIYKLLLLLCASITLMGCKYYSFTGISTDASSFQVNFFQNNAPLVEPGLDRDFTNELRNIIMNQTSLELKTANGDLIYDGEIVEYNVSPMSATADQTAAQNRLTIGVQVNFTDTRDSEKDFSQRFSFYYDYPATSQLSSVKTAAHDEILERITQDIVNKSLGDW